MHPFMPKKRSRLQGNRGCSVDTSRHPLTLSFSRLSALLAMALTALVTARMVSTRSPICLCLLSVQLLAELKRGGLMTRIP